MENTQRGYSPTEARDTTNKAVDLFLDVALKEGATAAWLQVHDVIDGIEDTTTNLMATMAVSAASKALRSEANRRADDAHKMAFHAIALPVSRDWTAEEILAREA